MYSSHLKFWFIFWQRKQKIKASCFVLMLIQWMLSKSGLRMNSAVPTGRYCIYLIRRWKKADECPKPKNHPPANNKNASISKKTGIACFFLSIWFPLSFYPFSLQQNNGFCKHFPPTVRCNLCFHNEKYKKRIIKESCYLGIIILFKKYK